MADTDIRRIVQRVTQGKGTIDAHLVEADRLDRREVPLLRRRLEEAGYWVGALDAELLEGPRTFFAALAEAFRFPGYFGHNWDAVIDCLSDLSWLSTDRCCCVLVNAAALRARDEQLFQAFLEACRFVAQRLEERSGPGDFKLVLC